LFKSKFTYPASCVALLSHVNRKYQYITLGNSHYNAIFHNVQEHKIW